MSEIVDALNGISRSISDPTWADRAVMVCTIVSAAISLFMLIFTLISLSYTKRQLKSAKEQVDLARKQVEEADANNRESALQFEKQFGKQQQFFDEQIATMKRQIAENIKLQKHNIGIHFYERRSLILKAILSDDIDETIFTDVYILYPREIYEQFDQYCELIGRKESLENKIHSYCNDIYNYLSDDEKEVYLKNKYESMEYNDERLIDFMKNHDHFENIGTDYEEKYYYDEMVEDFDSLIVEIPQKRNDLYIEMERYIKKTLNYADEETDVK